jgi:hypothetical protein
VREVEDDVMFTARRRAIAGSRQENASSSGIQDLAMDVRAVH